MKESKVSLYIKEFYQQNAVCVHNTKLFSKSTKKCDKVQTANLTTVTNQNDCEE